MLKWFFPVELEKKIVGLAEMFESNQVTTVSENVTYVIGSTGAFRLLFGTGSRCVGRVANGEVEWTIFSPETGAEYYKEDAPNSTAEGVLQDGAGIPLLVRERKYRSDIVWFAFHVSGYLIEELSEKFQL